MVPGRGSQSSTAWIQFLKVSTEWASPPQVGKNPLKVAVEHLKDQPYDPNDDVLKATAMELVSTLKELLTLHPLYNEQLKSFAAFGADFQDVSRLSDLAASLTSAQEGPLQEVLEQLNVPER